MPSLSLTTAVATSLLLFQHTSYANPLPNPEALSVFPREAENFVDCTPDQKDKINRALGDAATLANYAFGNIDTNSKAWSHYFRTDDAGKAEDLNFAKKVWSVIESNNDPTNPSFKFSIRCGKDDNPSCKDGKSVAITDAKPQDGDTLREMLICPLFFNPSSTETKNDLSSRKFETPKRGQDNSWCAPGNNFPWYEVAGHTILHEMTHLDVIGALAELPEIENTDPDGTTWKTHGTEDVSLQGTYPVAARALADIWHNNKQTDGTIKPYQNAENLAAAALEWFMMDQCAQSGNPIDEIKL
ncbi:hypothetical protein GQ53DRAFT_817596 [Thozetella sp. PMI_491]|nr:hypothetical protein GQ53DRAFT_817596 [Thozetella sp. PMI_491]